MSAISNKLLLALDGALPIPVRALCEPRVNLGEALHKFREKLDGARNRKECATAPVSENVQ